MIKKREIYYKWNILPQNIFYENVRILSDNQIFTKFILKLNLNINI